MDNYVGFIGSMQEMVRNPLYWDTVFVCNDGQVHLNKMVVGLIFPSLKSVDLFTFPLQATVILPDISLQNIQSMIKEKFENMKNGPGELNISIVKEEIESKEQIEVVNYFDDVENISETLFNDEINSDFNSFDQVSDIADTKFKLLRKRISQRSQKVFVDGVQQIECSECKEPVSNLSDHVAEKHADLDFKCDQCDFSSGSHALLKKHEKSNHKSIARECPICYKDIVCMDAHIKLVHGDRKSLLKHSCTQCDKSFPRATELRKHINTHLGLKEKCHICGKEISINKVREHIRQVHEKIKNHFCDECGMGFYEKKSYTKHVATHNTELIICPDCGKQTKNIEVHMKRFHSGIDRRVVCPECGKKVVQLSEHVNSVHKKMREIQCPQCPRMFFKRDTLKRHLLCHAKGGPVRKKHKPAVNEEETSSHPYNLTTLDLDQSHS